MNSGKVYFPNLNGLRFIAAFLVIIHHIEQYKFFRLLDGYWGKVPFISIIGKLGVVMFFVLSGFLITYLLISEEQLYKTISVRNFFARRFLRIWPLYFLIVALAFFVLPNVKAFILIDFEKAITYQDFLLKFFLYIVFLPNLALAIYGFIPFASHTWSIGTEEQFYIIWPFGMKFFRKNKISLMLFIICFYLSVRAMLVTSYTDFIPNKSIVIEFWSLFNIDCMAIGGLFAVFLFQRSGILKFLMNEYFFYFILLLVIVLILKGVYIHYYLHFEFYSVLFGIIILNFSANKKIRITLENRVLNYLGVISYGLYMYHPISIIMSIYVASLFSITTNWILYPLSFGLTITLAGLSYEYYEKPFLKQKSRFTRVISGGDVIK